jgi:hypothetical protein
MIVFTIEFFIYFCALNLKRSQITYSLKRLLLSKTQKLYN